MKEKIKPAYFPRQNLVENERNVIYGRMIVIRQNSKNLKC